MQAKIPHFDAGFLRKENGFSCKVKTIWEGWKNMGSQNNNNAPEMQNGLFERVLEKRMTQTLSTNPPKREKYAF
jgi:hypothetical protein